MALVAVASSLAYSLLTVPAAPAALAAASVADVDGDGALDRNEIEPGRDLRATRTLYVSPAGNDASPGTYERPLATRQKALTIATGGEAVLVLPGSYPSAQGYLDVLVARAGLRRPARGLAPRGGGHRNLGGQHLLVRDLKLTGTTQITSHPTLKTAQPAADVVLEDDELTVPGGLCLGIRSGATDIRVRRSRIHDSAKGIAGPNTPEGSHGTEIRDNVLQRLSGDGIGSPRGTTSSSAAT
jgi:hypothetical protein